MSREFKWRKGNIPRTALRRLNKQMSEVSPQSHASHKSRPKGVTSSTQVSRIKQVTTTTNDSLNGGRSNDVRDETLADSEVGTVNATISGTRRTCCASS